MNLAIEDFGGSTRFILTSPLFFRRTIFMILYSRLHVKECFAISTIYYIEQFKFFFNYFIDEGKDDNFREVIK